jgi:peptidoglycan/LPS O-acetylase OafA/YrhL
VTLPTFLRAATLIEAHFCCTFWSLVAEAQWYFVVPILALLWKWQRWSLHAGMLCTIGLVTFLAGSAQRLHLEVLNLSTLALYLPLFWAGIVISEIATTQDDTIRLALRRGGWLIVVLLGLFAIYRFAPRPPVWGFTKSQAYPFAVLYAGVLSVALFTNLGERFLSSAWLVKLGSFSYSLYLVHGLMVYVGIVLLDHFHIAGRRELILCLTLFPALSIGAAYLFYLLVEKRFQTHKVPPAVVPATDAPAPELMTATA